MEGAWVSDISKWSTECGSLTFELIYTCILNVYLSPSMSVVLNLSCFLEHPWGAFKITISIPDSIFKSGTYVPVLIF